MHEINEKKLPNKNSNQERPSKEYTKMYIFIVRSCGRRKKKNRNKEQSSRFTAAPKHLLSFIAKKPTTIEKKNNHISFALYFPHLPQFSEQPNRS